MLLHSATGNFIDSTAYRLMRLSVGKRPFPERFFTPRETNSTASYCERGWVGCASDSMSFTASPNFHTILICFGSYWLPPSLESSRMRDARRRRPRKMFLFTIRSFFLCTIKLLMISTTPTQKTKSDWNFLFSASTRTFYHICGRSMRQESLITMELQSSPVNANESLDT